MKARALDGARWVGGVSLGEARPATAVLCAAVFAFVALDLAQAWEFRASMSPPVGDEAVLTVAALDALDGEAPRGAYSRFGWHHPGPLLINQLELGLRALGRRPSVLPWCVAISNTCCIILGLLLISRERSAWLRSSLLVGTGLCFAALGRHMLPSMLIMIWNPIAALAPLFLLFCLAWSRERRPWVMPVVVLLHAYVVQAHLGYAAIGSLLAVITSYRVLREWRSHPASWAVLTLLTGLAAWSSLTTTWPNLLEIARFVTDRPDDGVPWSEALFLVARRTQPGVLLIAEGRPAERLALAMLGAQVLILSAHAGQRLTERRGVPWSVLALTLGSLAVAIASSFAVDDVAHLHQTHWFVLVGTFAWVGVLWPLFARGFPNGGWVIAALIVAVLFIGYGGESSERFTTWQRYKDDQARIARSLADLVEPLAVERPIRLQIDPRDSDTWGWAAVLAVTMDGRGHRVAIDPRFRFMFGERRTRCPPGCRALWLSRHRSPDGRELGSSEGLFVVEPAEARALRRPR